MMKQILKRVIVGILIGLFFMGLKSCKVNAISYVGPVSVSDRNTINMSDFYSTSATIRWNYLWYYSNSTLYGPKIAWVFDTSNTTTFNRDNLYTVSFIIYNEKSQLDNFRPIAQFNSADCVVNTNEYNTYLGSNWLIGMGAFTSVVCNDVRFDDYTSYLNLFLEDYNDGGNSQGYKNMLISPMYFTESTNNSFMEAMMQQLQQLLNINTSINTQTQTITQSTTDVINNQDENTESVNNNINTNMNNCSNIDIGKDNISVEGVALTSDGRFQTGADNRGVSKYIPISSLTINNTQNNYLCFYDINKNLISCINARDTGTGEYTIPNGTAYARFTLNYTDTQQYSALSCANRIDETNESIKEVNDTLKDDDVGEPQDYSSNVASNGVITQLITLPITLFQKLLNSTSASCNSFNLGSLYGSNLTMPCINLSNYLGSTLFNVIDLLISGFFIYHISRKMVKVFNSLSAMKEGDVING